MRVPHFGHLRIPALFISQFADPDNPRHNKSDYLSTCNPNMLDRITVHGARQHNLKNIDVEIPRNSLTVITGLSGSGKSSLAFDTIYA